SLEAHEQRSPRRPLHRAGAGRSKRRRSPERGRAPRVFEVTMTSVPLLAAAYVIFLTIAASLLVRISRRRPAGEWPHDEIPDLYAAFAYTLLVLAGLVLVVVA